jgi:hypothetical protein
MCWRGRDGRRQRGSESGDCDEHGYLTGHRLNGIDRSRGSDLPQAPKQPRSHDQHQGHSNDQASADEQRAEPISPQRFTTSWAHREGAITHRSTVATPHLPWSPLRLTAVGANELAGKEFSATTTTLFQCTSSMLWIEITPVHMGPNAPVASRSARIIRSPQKQHDLT